MTYLKDVGINVNSNIGSNDLIQRLNESVEEFSAEKKQSYMGVEYSVSNHRLQKVVHNKEQNKLKLTFLVDLYKTDGNESLPALSAEVAISSKLTYEKFKQFRLKLEIEQPNFYQVTMGQENVGEIYEGFLEDLYKGMEKITKDIDAAISEHFEDEE